jgi:hypothetical protein
MHHDAKRAVISVRIYRVDVRDLRHGQQGEQDQAHDGNRRQSFQPCAEIAAPKCLIACQYTYPYCKNTRDRLLDVSKTEMLPQSFTFEPNRPLARSSNPC